MQKKEFDIDRGCEAMFDLIKVSVCILRDSGDSEGNREALYCPGSFDLSIRNQKFAGISHSDAFAAEWLYKFT